jgi:hypothetical protein
MLFFYLNLKPINSIDYPEITTEIHQLVEESDLSKNETKTSEKKKITDNKSKNTD